MRILFVSNLFPPYALGGYEQWCEEVALALTARGHELCILTSQPDAANTALASGAAQPFPVHRLLHTEVSGGLGRTTLHLLRGPAHVEQINLRHTDAVVGDFRPDVVLIWGMWNIPRRVPQRLEALMNGRLGYFFCDYWPLLPNAYVQRLQEPARRTNLQFGKRLLAQLFLPRLLVSESIALHFPHPLCVSQAVRDILVANGVNIQGAQIIYGGTALAETAEASEAEGETGAMPGGDSPLRLLYLGRLEPIKGVHTVIHALGRLERSLPITLDIAGSGPTNYVSSLRSLVQQHDLENTVHFLGSVPHTQVPQVMANYNSLIFPSEWEEPFARSVLEAMAAGLSVIGSTTGGTGELLIDGQTGLTYTAGDSEELSRQIRRLAQDPAFRCRLAASGRSVVRNRFTLRRMVDELEVALCAMAGMPVRPSVQPSAGLDR